MADKISPGTVKAIKDAVVKELGGLVKTEMADFKRTFKGEVVGLAAEIDAIKEGYSSEQRDKHKLLLTEKLYDTDMREILEVSIISPMAAEPFAYALALDAKLGPEGQGNGVSLTSLVIDNILRLNLSGRGRNRFMSMRALETEVGTTVEGEETGRIPTVEAGGSR